MTNQSFPNKDCKENYNDSNYSITPTGNKSPFTDLYKGPKFFKQQILDMKAKVKSNIDQVSNIKIKDMEVFPHKNTNHLNGVHRTNTFQNMMENLKAEEEACKYKSKVNANLYNNSNSESLSKFEHSKNTTTAEDSRSYFGQYSKVVTNGNKKDITIKRVCPMSEDTSRFKNHFMSSFHNSLYSKNNQNLKVNKL